LGNPEEFTIRELAEMGRADDATGGIREGPPA
jgi:hypothetical protein